MPTKPPTDLLRKHLAEELARCGISDERLSEILGRVFPEKPLPSRKRAKLVRHEFVDAETLERFRREQILRMAEREFNRSDGNFAMDVRFVGGTRTIAVVRSGDEVTVWDLRKTVVRRRPSTKRMLAQRLPSVRVRSYEVKSVVVSRPEGTMVLAFPSQRMSGVTLTPDLLRERPSVAFLRVHHRNGMEECEVDFENWRDLVKSIPSFCRRCIRVEVSADGERWFDAFSILPSRR
jgi:hypothetical protein